MTATVNGMKSHITSQWPSVLCYCLILGAFVIASLSALSLGLGSLASPEAGLWPFLTAALGCLLTLALVLKTVVRPSSSATKKLFSDVSWGPVAVFIAAISGFLVLYPIVGFLIAGIPMAFVLLKYASGASWVTSIVTACIVPVALYFTFTEFLNVRL